MRIEPSDDIGETVAGVEACDAGAKVAFRWHMIRDDLSTALAARQVVMTGVHRIDAITLTTPDMAASIAFYRAVGFTISFGGDDSEFTTMSIEPNGLTSISSQTMKPIEHWSPGVGRSFMSTMSTIFTNDLLPPVTNPTPSQRMPHGASDISQYMTRAATTSVSQDLSTTSAA